MFCSAVVSSAKQQDSSTLGLLLMRPPPLGVVDKPAVARCVVVLQGSGFDALTTAVDCRVCRGSGEIMVRHWSPESSSSDSDGSSSSSSAGIGMLTIPRSCPACRGSGRDDQQHCQQ